MSDLITVLIVDDHPMVRDGLDVFLSVYDDLQVIGAVESGAAALDIYPHLTPNVILMDMVMPGLDGVSTIKQMRANGWTAPIIALTSFDDQSMVQLALQAGAVGFLHKDVHADKLADAIRKAAAGQGTLDAAATQALIETHQPQPGYDLTPREKEVLQLLAEGKTNKEIGTRLHISLATVRLHVSHVLSKLNAANRTEAVSIALRQDLL